MSEPKPILYPLRNLLAELEADARVRNEAKLAGQPLGPVTGFPKLDRELGNALQSGLHILHGAPGTGKSALALQIAASCGCPALLVSCEMSPLELLRRHTARITNTYLGKFKSGELSPQEVMHLAQKACFAAPLMAILDATTAPLSVTDLQDFASAVRDSVSGNKHLLIVVDSVHSWVRGYAGELEEYTALNEGLRGLREVAQTVDAAVLGIGERNRLAMRSGGINASAGSRMFEYSAETVLDLDYRDDIKKEFISEEKHLKITFSKNRNGSAGKTIPMIFKGGFQLFTEG